MMMLGFLTIPIALGWSVYAQSSSSVVCVAGQCMQGYTNITIGAKLTASGAPTSIQLLPGQYTTTTNPQLLHDILTSPSASLSPSPGFENSTSSTSLPLNLALEPGLAIFSQSHYSGQSGFSKLPTTPVGNTSTPLTAGSIALSSNVWVALTTGSNSRIVLWDSVPDVNQLPSGTAQRGLALVDVQSTACSPACAGSGVCSAAGTCICSTGFTGESCESCEKGFFGPTCQACPAGCTSCDDGISGSGRCLAPVLANAPSTCNCLNGQCGSDGQCACNAGWTTADNGTACAKCAPGFFQTSTGDCQVCQLGCTQCVDGTGACIACKAGFTQDANDKTKCNPVQSVTSTGTVCPDGSFSDGAKCSLCSPSCKTCSGPTSNDCIICATGQYMFNGHCVGTNSDGVCEGSSLIANNNKHECDTCGAKCTSCKIPNFSVASTVDQAQCAGCLPGFVLSQGRCVESCPSGSFVSPQDNLTCIPCSSSCGTCAGSADFCLTCPGNRLASSGKCVDACPSNTFSSSGSCLTCHPDCASCSGPSFTQCSSCPPNRPVLANGRCLPTCGKSQYFDTTTSTCQACDSSCSSCSGPGPSSCLACSSANQVLRAGACVAASCEGSTGVIPGLGVCLSELVQIPAPSGTGGGAPALPSITGLTNPTVVHTTTRRPLAWWEILLMTLGCAFIFLVVLMLWRRRARRQRAKRTVRFATAKNLVFKPTWRWRLARLFGRGRPCNFEHVHPYVVPYPRGGVGLEETKARDLGEAEEARGGSGSRRDTRLHLSDDELDNFINAYDYSRSSRAPSTLPSLHDYHNGGSQGSGMKELKRSNNRLSLHSLYSQVTGVPRQMPEPRQPVRKELLLPFSLPASSGSSARYSSSTLASSNRRHPSSAGAEDSGRSAMAGGGGQAQIQEREPSHLPSLDSHRQPTEAEAYAMAVRPMLVRIQPDQTGGSSSSRNPFRML